VGFFRTEGIHKDRQYGVGVKCQTEGLSQENSLNRGEQELKRNPGNSRGKLKISVRTAYAIGVTASEAQ